MTTWEFYFMTIVGWQLHPGFTRENAQPLTLTESADLATEMCKHQESACH